MMDVSPAGVRWYPGSNHSIHPLELVLNVVQETFNTT
jgi:hypothetical protein